MTRLVRRWAVWAAIGLAVVAALVIGAQRGGSQPTLAQRTQSLSQQVRCPVCGGETAAQSQTAAAVDIRNQIRQELAGGVPPKRVLDDLVSAYGPSILERPPATGFSLVVWVLPVVAVVAAAVGLVLAFARWRRARPGAAGGTTGGQPPSPQPDDEALVAKAMAASPPPAPRASDPVTSRADG